MPIRPEFRQLLRLIGASPPPREPEPVIESQPAPPPVKEEPFSIQSWLKGGRSREIDFSRSPSTYGAIQCKLYEYLDGATLSATGAGSTDGDALEEALRAWDRQAVAIKARFNADPSEGGSNVR